VKSLFPVDTRWLQEVHILDLSESGFIGPHIDSVKFSGPTIATLSLISTRVMRLKHAPSESIVDVLVEPRSLYVMKDFVRFEWTHEILGGEVNFNGKKFKYGRRVSLVFRDEVDPNNPYFKKALESSSTNS
jgi:alkylated DNA repair protein alkB family protein 7